MYSAAMRNDAAVRRPKCVPCRSAHNRRLERIVLVPIKDAAAVLASVEALLAINPEYVHFWCPKCAATYCREHWYPIDPTMDEGFYDATYGTCPKGHKVMLDD